MKKVAIIGVGLIGGSLGLALKKCGLAEEVVGIGRRQESLDKALRVGAVDRTTLELEEGVRDAELIVVATPVGLIPEMVKRCVPVISQGAIVTDVGSTKKTIVNEIDNLIPEGIFFIGGHPLAGSEKRGAEEAKVDMFKDSVCILTPDKEISPAVLEKVKWLWETVGAKVNIMTPDEHDFFVAATSHLPHLLAVALVNLVDDLQVDDKRILSLIAGGFKDTTRIASSSPELWRDICLNNKDNLKVMISKFKKLLDKAEENILEEDKDRVKENFSKAKAFRDKL